MPDNEKPVVALKIIVRPRVTRVVLDTNLFVAAYWSARSASARIITACEAGELCLLVSAAIKRELFRILHNARTSASHQERIRRLVTKAEEIYPRRKLQLVEEDPEDDKFLECAVEGNAGFLISNDEHLLRLKQVEGVSIVTPGDMAWNAQSYIICRPTSGA